MRKDAVFIQLKACRQKITRDSQLVIKAVRLSDIGNSPFQSVCDGARCREETQRVVRRNTATTATISAGTRIRRWDKQT